MALATLNRMLQIEKGDRDYLRLVRVNSRSERVGNRIETRVELVRDEGEVAIGNARWQGWVKWSRS